jgi:hypothetical protein
VIFFLKIQIKSEIMKLNIIINGLLFSGAAMLFAQCSGEKKDDTVTDTVELQEAEKHEEVQDVTKTEAGKPQFTVDEIFRKQLTSVFDSYAGLKDAFVSSDAGKVKKEARKTLDAISSVDMKLVSGAAHNDWMTYKDEMEKSLESIGASADIEDQRVKFSYLSGSLYKTIKAYGLSGEKAYYDFCPMAFDDKGAYWLSKEEKIQNPYFGDKMLTCGSVEETLQ